MEEKVLLQTALKTDADYEAAIQAMYAEMDRIDERIKKDQAEIDRLKAETRAMLMQLSKA